MLEVIGYKIVRKIFRRHFRIVRVPQYKDLGVGKVREKPASKEIKRET